MRLASLSHARALSLNLSLARPLARPLARTQRPSSACLLFPFPPRSHLKEVTSAVSHRDGAGCEKEYAVPRFVEVVEHVRDAVVRVLVAHQMRTVPQKIGARDGAVDVADDHLVVVLRK